jgi:hypothetical protein
MAVVVRVFFDYEAGDKALRLSRVMPDGKREGMKILALIEYFF